MSKAFSFTRLFADAASKRYSATRRCGRRKLLVEALEDRRVPANFAPDVFTDEFDGNFDPGDLSLREAVHLANITPGADTIQLLPSVYLLSRAGRGENNNVTGDLDVTDSAGLTIRGALTAPSIIDADGIDRAFEVIGSGALTLIGVTVRGGSETNGGGFRVSSQSSLTLQDSAVHSNLATNRGGAVDNNGTLTIIGSTFASNIAGDFEFSGAGGAINNSSGLVSIRDSVFDSNRAFVEGGAINDRSGRITVTESIFMSNQADAAGGGGGAISTQGTIITIADSTFTGNIAAKGGAIQGRGEVTVTGSLLRQNQATVPIPAYNLGGALYNLNFMKVVNTTIVDNVAGSASSLGFGGAIENLGGFQLIHATVTGNRASDGGGVRNSGSGVVIVTNSIIAQNTTTAAGNRLDVWGAFSSLGGNFLGYAGGGTGWIASDQTSFGLLDPKLGPLQDNGGPTFTRAPLAGSPVLDTGVDGAGFPANVTLPATDQRGLLRPSGPGYDIGAYEFQAPVGNRPPVAVADSYAVDEDGILVVPAPGPLANDSDPDGDSMTAFAVTSPVHGTVTFNTNGSFTYTPHPNYHGPDSFTYRPFDGMLLGDAATVSLTINPVNDAPTADNDVYGTDEDTPLVAAAQGVLIGDADVDGDTLSAVLVTGPAHGSLTLNSDGSFTYAPQADYHGVNAPDSFTYRAFDGAIYSNVATVIVTVNPVNDAPTAGDNSYSTDEDTALVVTAAQGVLTGAADVDGDAMTAVLVAGPAHGALTLNSDGSFSYTPAANYHGPDSFTYRAFDGALHSDIATVNLTVTPVNDAPVANNDAYSVDQNGSLAVSAPQGVLANDTDVDGDQLTAALVTAPAHGTLTLNSDGSFTYVPAFRFHGADSFTYQSSDGEFVTAPVTVAIVVNRVTHTVPIDIAPGDSSNTIDVNRDSKVEVAILSTAAFDAQNVIVESLRFGKTGTEDSLYRHHKTGRLQYRYEDVNGDGRLDLIVAFDVDKTGLAVGDAQAVLRGELTDGSLLEAAEIVNVVASNKPGKGRK